MTTDEILAKKLVEKSMLVANFENYQSFMEMLTINNFKIVSEEDFSIGVLPSLKRFENYANILFLIPKFLAKTLLKIFPQEFTQNAIAGYLLGDLIESKTAKYMAVVCKN